MPGPPPQHAKARTDRAARPSYGPSAPSSSSEPTLGSYLGYVRRHRGALTLATLCGVIFGALWLLLAGRTYSAQSLVMITPPVLIATDGLSPAQPTVDTEAGIAASDAVVGRISDATGMAIANARNSLVLSAPVNTRLIKIRFVADDAVTAIAGANAAAEGYVLERHHMLTEALTRQLEGLERSRRQLSHASASRDPDGIGTPAAAQTLGDLTTRIEELRATPVRPGSIQLRATSAFNVTRRNAPVPLTSGAVAGFLAGCVLLAARDAWRPRMSTSRHRQEG